MICDRKVSNPQLKAILLKTINNNGNNDKENNSNDNSNSNSNNNSDKKRKNMNKCNIKRIRKSNTNINDSDNIDNDDNTKKNDNVAETNATETTQHNIKKSPILITLKNQMEMSNLSLSSNKSPSSPYHMKTLEPTPPTPPGNSPINNPSKTRIAKNPKRRHYTNGTKTNKDKQPSQQKRRKNNNDNGKLETVEHQEDYVEVSYGRRAIKDELKNMKKKKKKKKRKKASRKKDHADLLTVTQDKYFEKETTTTSPTSTITTSPTTSPTISPKLSDIKSGVNINNIYKFIRKTAKSNTRDTNDIRETNNTRNNCWPKLILSSKKDTHHHHQVILKDDDGSSDGSHDKEQQQQQNTKDLNLNENMFNIMSPFENHDKNVYSIKPYCDPRYNDSHDCIGNPLQQANKNAENRQRRENSLTSIFRDVFSSLIDHNERTVSIATIGSTNDGDGDGDDDYISIHK